MSVTIKYRPASDGGKSFGCGTSSDLTALERVFGTKIDEKDVPQLRAMAQVGGGYPFYDKVADVIEKVGAISVWGEW